MIGAAQRLALESATLLLGAVFRKNWQVFRETAARDRQEEAKKELDFDARLKFAEGSGDGSEERFSASLEGF